MKVNDKKIINYIKYLPFYFLIITTAIFFLYMTGKHFYDTNLEKKQLQIDLQKEYEENVKYETLKVVDYINKLKSNKTNEIVKLLKEKSDTAHAIVENIYNTNKDKSKDEIIKLIKNALEKIRYFDGRGYYYILDSKSGFCYFHPVFKELENKSLLEITDTKGKYLTKDMMNIIKENEEGYLKYYWHKENDKINQYEKIAYVKKFEPLGIFFVISDYMESINTILKNDVKNFLSSVNLQNSNNNYFVLDKNNNTFVFHNIQNSTKEFPHISDCVVDYQKLINNFEERPNGFHKCLVKSEDNSILKKVAYVQTIEDWDWIIGIGFYEKDIENMIEKEEKALEETHLDTLFSTLIFILAVSIVVLIISRYSSKIIEKRFKIYNFSINRKIVEIARQQKILAQQTKMAAIGEMIENIAHQWRQPLSIISTLATGLKVNKEFGNLDDENFYKSVDSINESAQYLSQTIDDFRNFYKSSNEKKHFNIDEMIEKSLNLLKSKFTSNDIEIIKEIKRIKYYGLESELMQVILNFLNNSIDQFESLNDKDHKYFIKINAYRKDNKILLEFIDNGGGIKNDVIDRIFEPYFTTKNKNIGTGIGLYMSKNIVEKHFNGKIEAKNITLSYDEKSYKCAKFIITL